MNPYYEDSTVRLFAGDCLDVLTTIPDASVDAVVTDPPAAIGFMSKTWDHDKGGRTEWVTWLTTVMAECCRILKPGGHAVVWALPRTSHWTAWAIEDGGLIIRDCIVHLFGTGFPKSLDVGKAIDKAAPRVGMFNAFAAHFKERRIALGLAQKEIAAHFPSKTGGMTGCVWNWENGANVPTPAQWAILAPMLDIPHGMWADLIDRVEAEREVIGTKLGQPGYSDTTTTGRMLPTLTEGGGKGYLNVTAPATDAARQWQGWGTSLKPASEHWWLARKPLVGNVAANVLARGTGALNIDSCRIEHRDAADLAESAGKNRHADFGTEPGGNAVYGDYSMVPRKNYEGSAGRWPANVVLDDDQARVLDQMSGDAGGGFGVRGASTQIYGGGKGFTEATGETVGYGDTGGASRFFYTAKASSTERVRVPSLGGDAGVSHVAHPT